MTFEDWTSELVARWRNTRREDEQLTDCGIRKARNTNGICIRMLTDEYCDDLRLRQLKHKNWT